MGDLILSELDTTLGLVEVGEGKGHSFMHRQKVFDSTLFHLYRHHSTSL